MALSMKLWLWLFLTLAIVQPSVAAPARHDALAEALALPVASALIGAEDAPRFAWVETAAGVRNIWLTDVGRPARRLTAYTQDDGQALYDLALSRDGASIAFVRGGDPEFADEEVPNANSDAAPPSQRVFVASTVGGAPVLIGEGHSPIFAPDGKQLAFTRKGEIWLWQAGQNVARIATVAGEVRRMFWSPDSKRLLFIDHREDYSFVALLNLADARLRYLDAGLGFAVEPAFSPDGGQIAFIRYLDPPLGASRTAGQYWSIHVAAVNGPSRTLWTAPAGEGSRYAATSGRNLHWGANGELLFAWERGGWLHAYALDADGGTPRDLTPGAFEVDSFLLTRDRRSLIYAANAGDLGRRHVWRRPLRRGGPVQLTTGDGVESRPTLGGDALAVMANNVMTPAHPALVGRSLAPLGQVATARGFTTPTTVRFRAADGVEVHGQLFSARGKGKKPALIYVHGGPRRQMFPGFHPSAYYSNAYVLNQYLASQGYDVLSVNYRSGTGYGGAFRNAEGIGREGASEYRDILAAGRWLAARPNVDPARIGIWGGSWGGYLTALALARDSKLFAAGVDFHGVHSLLRPVPDSLSPAAQAAIRDVQWRSSPLAAIGAWTSPVLLIHGDDDKNVKFAQSVILARELAARQIPFRTLIYPNERHGFLRHAHWLESFRATADFFDETVMRKPTQATGRAR